MSFHPVKAQRHVPSPGFVFIWNPKIRIAELYYNAFKYKPIEEDRHHNKTNLYKTKKKAKIVYT